MLSDQKPSATVENESNKKDYGNTDKQRKATSDEKKTIKISQE